MYEILLYDFMWNKDSQYNRLWFGNNWEEAMKFLKDYTKNKEYVVNESGIIQLIDGSGFDQMLGLFYIGVGELGTNRETISKKQREDFGKISEHEQFALDNIGKIVMIHDRDEYSGLAILGDHIDDGTDWGYSYITPTGEKKVNRFGSTLVVTDQEVYQKLFTQ